MDKAVLLLRASVDLLQRLHEADPEEARLEEAADAVDDALRLVEDVAQGRMLAEAG